MPVFNEQDAIAEVVEDFSKVLDQFEKPEFIIVNDKSTDKTLSVLENLRLKYPYLRVIDQLKNMGHGPTLMRAFLEAKGEYVFHCDSDNQFSAHDFWSVWNKFKEENCDVVIGFRKERNDPLVRLLLTRFLRLFLLIFFRVWFLDSNCPFRLYHRKALDQILKLLPEKALIPSILMAIAAHKLSFKIGWISVQHKPRLTGKSLIRGWKIFNLCLPAVREVFDFREQFESISNRHEEKKIQP